jgi:thiamine kinase-like enzyme
MLSTILSAYGINNPGTIDLLTSGLINKTWKVTEGKDEYIVQQINHHVFKKPFEVAHNIRMIDGYLKENTPHYLFVSPVATTTGVDILHIPGEGYFRAFPFIKNTHTINVATTPDQAFEAAFQFGTFTRNLSGFDAGRLHATIPNFHNLLLRYTQFEESLQKGNRGRIAQSKSYIDKIKSNTHILEEYTKIRTHSDVKLRVTHHDTKISNVLFDNQGKGLCVIDLDTIMPGYFISDVGDMFRTYVSPANEEESDFSKIEVREDFFKAIVHGYVSSVGNQLTKEEQSLLFYAGLFLTYMQAIRFLTDYCNNDVYYGARYEEQNFVRAGNQLHLLEKLVERSTDFKAIINKELK